MTTDMTKVGEVPQLEAVLSAVAHDHRRAVLRSLARADEGLSARALTERVAQRVRSDDLSDGRHRRQVRTALHHAHLPKLEECGLIVRDDDSERIRSDTGELAHELLSVLEPYEPRV